MYHTPRADSFWGHRFICIKLYTPSYNIQNTAFTNIDKEGNAIQFPHISINFVYLYVKYSQRSPVNDIIQHLSQSVHSFIAADYYPNDRRRNCQSITRCDRSPHNLILQLRHHAADTPTHFGTDNSWPYIIDLALTETLPFLIITTIIKHLICYYLPISFKIHLVNPLAPLVSVAVNWRKFQTYLNNSDLSFPTIINSYDINNAVINFQSLTRNT